MQDKDEMHKLESLQKHKIARIQIVVMYKTKGQIIFKHIQRALFLLL